MSRVSEEHSDLGSAYQRSGGGISLGSHLQFGSRKGQSRLSIPKNVPQNESQRTSGNSRLARPDRAQVNAQRKGLASAAVVPQRTI